MPWPMPSSGSSSWTSIRPGRHLWETNFVHDLTSFKLYELEARGKGCEFSGTPTGIDIFKVIETGITPAMDIGIAGRNGGQIGAGVVRAAADCFHRAAEAYRAQYGME